MSQICGIRILLFLNYNTNDFLKLQPGAFLTKKLPGTAIWGFFLVKIDPLSSIQESLGGLTHPFYARSNHED